MAKTLVENRKKKSIKKLREILSHPDQRGRVVRPTEIYRMLKMTKPSFYRNLGPMILAQEWLTINQDAPIDAKLHYQEMLKKEVNEMETEFAVQTKDKTLHISREEARKKTVAMSTILTRNIGDNKNAIGSIKQLGAKTVETTKTTVLKPASEKEVIIRRIRDSFILAAIGEMPNVTRIMKEFGLLDQKNPVVTEDEVRKVMVEEDWKGARSEQLYRTMDMIPEEVKMITMTRNVEAQKILFDEMKLLHRNNRQYYTTGRVKSLDGSTDLNWTPDAGTMAGIAEVMRRMVDGGNNINILINQFGETKGKGSMTLVSRAYLSKLSEFNPDELRDEISRFEELSKALGGGSGDIIDMNFIEAQDEKTIDIKTSSPSEA